jgi:hypothetical protein
MASPAALALEGGDPRLSNGLELTGHAGPTFRKLHDPSVSFEEYLHYAKECRAWENSDTNAVQGDQGFGAALKGRLGRSSKQLDETTQGVDTEPELVHNKGHGKSSMTNASPTPDTDTGTVMVTNDGGSTTARAPRTATWGAVF